MDQFILTQLSCSGQEHFCIEYEKIKTSPINKANVHIILKVKAGDRL